MPGACKRKREVATQDLFGEILCDCDWHEIDVFLVSFLIELSGSRNWTGRDAIVRALEALVWGDADEAADGWSVDALGS